MADGRVTLLLLKPARRLRRLFYFLAAACLAALSQPTRADELPLNAKIGQTIMATVDNADAENYRRTIETGLIGGVLLQWGEFSLEDTKLLIDKLQGWAAKSPAKIPLIIAVDYEGGPVYAPTTLGLNNLPTNRMIGRAGDESGCAALFYLAGMELRRAGFNMSFAPVLDVNTAEGNPAIGVRSFGDDTAAVARMGVAAIHGLEKSGVAAVAKHFPGHGAAEADSHLTVPIINLSSAALESKHIEPFKKAIAAETSAIMTAHVLYQALDPEYPATFSEKIISGLLKTKLGFKGIVVSDSLDMRGATQKRSAEAAAVSAMKAGVDLLLIGKHDPARINAGIQKALGSAISRERLDDAYKKVTALKLKLGLMSPDRQPVEETSAAYEEISAAISRKAVSVVKNDRPELPVALREIAKSTPAVCSVFFSPPRYAQDLLEISRAFLEAGLNAEHYTLGTNPSDKDTALVLRCAKSAGLLLIGSFQWADKPYAAQVKAVRRLLAANPNSVLVSIMSPYDLKWYPQAQTAIATYGINRYSVRAVAEVILKPRENADAPKPAR